MTDEYRDFLLKRFRLRPDKSNAKPETDKGSVRCVKLNGARMRSNKGTHAYLARKLRFPSYYGNNLDALYDELSTVSEPLTIKIRNTKILCENLGEYGQAILNTFEDARRSNANIEVIETD